MTDLNEFLAAMAVALALGVFSAMAIYRPLRRALGVVCGTDAGAAFWTGYSVLFLVLLPMFGVATAIWWGGNEISVTEALSRIVSVAIAFLVMALLAVGRELKTSIREQLANERYPTQSARDRKSDDPQSPPPPPAGAQPEPAE